MHTCHYFTHVGFVEMSNCNFFFSSFVDYSASLLDSSHELQNLASMKTNSQCQSDSIQMPAGTRSAGVLVAHQQQQIQMSSQRAPSPGVKEVEQWVRLFRDKCVVRAGCSSGKVLVAAKGSASSSKW